MRCLRFSLLILILLAEFAEAQFLSRDFRRLWANEVFENYGAAGYRDYDLEEENRRFDFFGDLLIDGVDIIEYSEIRRDTPGLRGSYERRNSRYNRFFQKLIIANEGFGPWSSRLIIGDHIRTYFTPMTLNLPSFHGIRWDGSSRKHRFSVIATHLTDPVFVPSGLGITQYLEQRRIFGTSLIGGHWESQIGDMLKLGTTYVNAHRFNAEASAKSNSLKGTIPQVFEGGFRKIYVFFTDDAPHDGFAGAEVHELTMFADGTAVAPVRVGRIQRLLRHIPVTQDVTSTILLKANEVDYLRRNRAWLQAVVEASNRPFFKLLDGIARDVAPASSRAPLQANGTDVVFYEYAVTDTVRELTFSAVVANDYSVDVVGATQVSILAAGADDFYYDWYNASRAKGHPNQRSNLRRIEFRYGIPTGLTVLGLNFDAELLGCRIQGEYARSINFLQVPTAKGTRHENQTAMFYINFLRPLHPKAELGFEWFDVPATYTTEFPIFKRSRVFSAIGGRLYSPFALVEDNDDLDDWPDRVEHDDPLAPYSSSIGQGHGVFPGLDPDKDGVLDFDVDRGGDPDAFQPFLGYYAEPADLVYGDDFNNNGVADFRENDNLPDYLYPVDHRGIHGFVTLQPRGDTQVRLGAYRVRQPALGIGGDMRYIEGQYWRTWVDLGYIRLNHRLKWVEDEIQNTIYRQTANNLLRPDRLENRDSINNLTYFEWGLSTVPDLNIRNIVSFNHIDLGGALPEDPLFAKPGAITHFTMVNKLDYTWYWGRFKVMPQFKHIFQRSKFPDRQIPDVQRRWTMPILRVDYRLGPNTVLKTGAQGFPVLAERSLDAASPTQDFRRKTYTAFVQNQSNYRGYDLTILMGIYRTRSVYTGSARPPSGYVEHFFRVYIG